MTAGAEVASAFVTLVPSARGFAAGIDREIGGDVDKSGHKSGTRFGGAFASAGTKLIAPLAAAAGAAAIGGFLKDSIAQASDLNEAGTKLDAIFGKAGAAQVQAFAATGPKALGQNKLAVLDSAASFGTFGKAAGLAGGDLAKFGTGFSSLSTDLASFYNADPAEAAQAIGAALRGEAEPIRRFGVLLDDATLRTEALKLGLIKTTKQALTPQQKVLAAQAAIYRQTKDAQGDFAKTSGGLANQQRILAAQFTDIKGRVGSALLPILVKLAQFATGTLLPGISKLGPVFTAIGRPIGQFAGFIGDALGTLRTAVVGTQSFGLAFSAFFAALREGDVTSNGLVGKFEAVGDAIHRAIPVVLGFGASVRDNAVPIIRQLVTVFQTAVIPAIRQVAGFVIGTLIPTVISFYTTVASNVIPIVKALVAVFVANVIPTLQRLYTQFATNVLPVLIRVGTIVVKVAGFLGRLAATIIGTVLPPLIRFAGPVLGFLVTALGTVIGTVFRVIGKVLDFIGAIGRAAGAVGSFVGKVVGFFLTMQTSIAAKITGVVSTVKGLPGRALAALGDVGSLLVHAGEDLVKGFAKGIINSGHLVLDAAKGLASGAKDKVTGFLHINSPSKVFAKIGTSIPEGMALGIQSGAGSVNDAVQAMVPAPRIPSFGSSGFAPSSGQDVAAGGAGITQQNTFVGMTPEEALRESNRRLVFALQTA